MAFLINALMCTKEVKLIASWLSAYFDALVFNAVHNACLLNAALFNAVCFHNDYVFSTDFYNCYFFSCFVMVYWHIVCLFQVLFCIMYSAFNLLVFIIMCSHCFFQWNGYVLSRKIARKNNNYYFYLTLSVFLFVDMFMCVYLLACECFFSLFSQ